ncbi:hypothetical protein SAMN04488494_0623 [Xylanibacter ruminicola]|uniref:Lipoprotein n=1 Tax=Xylanibacter ruminicola TaxID=839 RepID=A0A1M7D4B0_XYLRU|nr:hypothetical protein [Xylanibacter ruminicola]SHL74285.1 hypothetical protein SAMN04488494_0623 [Xylanibacter ruminicola]
MRKLVFFMLLLVACVFNGCRTQKVFERIDTRDSFLTERVESIVYVQVPVEFEIPAQTASIVTMDSTSHLETDFAISDAKLSWRDGVPYLFHSLENKPQKINKDVTIPVRHIRLKYYKTVYRTRYREKVIEKQLTLYQRAVLNFAPWIIIGLLIWLVIIRLRKG